MSSSEKTRNLMLKNSASSSASNSSQPPSNLVNINVFKGTSMKSALESQNHPTNFVASSSEFDNSIIVTCPPVEKIERNLTSDPNSARKVSSQNVPGNNTTVFVHCADSIANNPFIAACPPIE